jgi:hypothetical protein
METLVFTSCFALLIFRASSVVAILVIVFRSDLDADLVRSVRDCAIGHSVPLWIFLSCSVIFVHRCQFSFLLGFVGSTADRL